MRIISGRYKGLKLNDPHAKAQDIYLRPTTDRVRENLFNLLAHANFIKGNYPQNAHVLDFFAGSGAIGIEALSRGATSATFIDNNPISQKLIRANLSLLHDHPNTSLLNEDATALSKSDFQYNLIFLDPPYGKGLGQMALESALKNNWIAKDAVIIWEEENEQTYSLPLQLLAVKKYGASTLHFLTPHHD